MKFPVRKSTRISGYDYSTQNFYFVTICTHEKTCIFGRPNELNSFGKIAEECLHKIQKFYPHASVDKYVVMPNHIHMIIVISNDGLGKNLSDLTRIVGQYKMAVTKKIRSISENAIVWQRSFHDHIIRNTQGYEKIWEYIENNPYKWEEDCFYIKQSIEERVREGQCPSPTEG